MKDSLTLNNEKTNNLMKNQAKDLNRHLTKEDIQVASKHIKRYWTSYALGNFKWKRDATAYLLERPKAKNTDIIKCWQQELSSLFVRIQNSIGTLAGSLAVSYKIKHTHIFQPINCTCWYLQKRVRNVCLHKNLPMDVTRSRNAK